jgi:hypothetical protein
MPAEELRFIISIKNFGLTVSFDYLEFFQQDKIKETVKTTFKENIFY